jgi:nitrogen fixation NifU-like protein
MYTKELMKRFRNPKFMKKIKDPDGVGQEGNQVCGDVMKVYIKVKDNKIVDIGFETFGCPAAIAASDALCELANGKTLEQASKIAAKDIVKVLGEMPPIKVHCSVLGMKTLKNAIADYKKRKKNG